MILYFYPKLLLAHHGIDGDRAQGRRGHNIMTSNKHLCVPVSLFGCSRTAQIDNIIHE